MTTKGYDTDFFSPSIEVVLLILFCGLLSSGRSTKVLHKQIE